MQERLERVQGILRDQQMETRGEDTAEPLLYKIGDLVLLENKRRKKGINPKLQAKFVGPYEVIRIYPNHTYDIERQGQWSRQNECRLKLYTPCTVPSGKAPATLEPSRRPHMKGARNRPSKSCEVEDLNPVHPVARNPLVQVANL